MVLCLVMLAIAAPVLAAAQKVPLNRSALAERLDLPGGGFVVFNNSAGAKHNVEVTVSLKGVEADTTYDIYFYVDKGTYPAGKVATITTNGQGNANFHMNGSVPTGKHNLLVDVVYKGTKSDLYITSWIPMNFK